MQSTSRQNRPAPPVRLRPADGKAYVAGACDEPLLQLTVPALLERTVVRRRDHEAAVFCAAGQRWSYGELAERVDRLAAGLLALGIYKGDRVGIWSPNRPEWLLTQFATARIGAILVTINPAYRTAELEHALVESGVKALVSAVSFKTGRYLDMLRALAPELDRARPGRLAARRLPALRTVIQLGNEALAGMVRFGDVMALGSAGQRSRLNAITRSLLPHDPINIQFTSGTTGAPKGATLSHENIVNNAYFTARMMRFGARDRLCIPVPLYHCFGMVLGNLVCIAAGAAMVFPGEGFEAGETLRALHQERCTALHGVPTMFISMLNHPDFARFDLRALRTGIMAGAPCPIELMRKVIADMHLAELTIAYGMTETSPVSFQTAHDDPPERRVATVGRIHPHVEAKVIDAEGHTVAVGENGELCTRGYLVMKGYWQDALRSSEAIDEQGWMHTGDLATIDEQGYCSIVGRVKDMLIRGGENVYPREIEEFLLRHPDILDAQVFGVPDQRLGEEVCAWIVQRSGAQLGEDEVKDFCRAQIAHYKIPRYVRFIDELPMTVTGKAQKYVMREKMIEMLGLGSA